MKRILIGALVAAGAAFALTRLAKNGRKMREHCREMMAGRQQSKPTESSPGGC